MNVVCDLPATVVWNRSHLLHWFLHSFCQALELRALQLSEAERSNRTRQEAEAWKGTDRREDGERRAGEMGSSNRRKRRDFHLTFPKGSCLNELLEA